MMSTKKIEVKVAINCEKCKVQVMSAVARLQGIDELSVDVQKGILTVIGTVDPVSVVTKTKKAKIYAEIISVGPPKKPEPAKPPEPSQPLPPCCKQCQLVGVSHVIYDHDSPICSIL